MDMGLYKDLGIRDDMPDAELATHLSQQRSLWNSRRSSPDIRERMDAEQKVRQIDVLAGAEARIGDFPVPALVIKTLCAAIDNRYADYRGLESTVLRSVNEGVYRGEFRTVLGYLNSIGAQDIAGEWRNVLADMGIHLPAARNMSRGSTERSEQREYLERHERAQRAAGQAPSGDEYAEDQERSREGRPASDQRTRSSARTGENRSRSGSGRKRKKKVSWQRKVKRFFRRIGRFFRSIHWDEIPKQLIAIVAGVIAAIIVVSIVISTISRSHSSQNQQAATDSSAVSTTTTAEQEAQLAQDALIARLRGMESFTQTTDASAVVGFAAVVPAQCDASSSLVGTTGRTYGTEYLFDNDLTTSWQEGEADEGIGVTITSTFASETNIRGIAFWIGNETSAESYMANNRPENVTISVSCEGQSYSKQYTLQDVNGEQVILFETAVPMESVVIRIDSVYAGTVYNDTVISELAFLSEDAAGSTAASGSAVQETSSGDAAGSDGSSTETAAEGT